MWFNSGLGSPGSMVGLDDGKVLFLNAAMIQQFLNH